MTPPSPSPFVIMSCPQMRDLASQVVALLRERYDTHFPHYFAEHTRFPSDEDKLVPLETVRRQGVFLFHSLQFPTPNESFMRMMILCDALRRASVAEINLVVPNICYLRQDRKSKRREPISAKLIADIIETNKSVKRVITADMHTDQGQGFFSIPVDNLTARRLFAEHVRSSFGDLSNVVVATPDVGGSTRARAFAKLLGVPLVICNKQRDESNAAEILEVIGDVRGKTVIALDDIIDTGGSIRKTGVLLKEEYGARAFCACATHGIFSGTAVEEFAHANIPIICTDSIPRPPAFYETHRSWLTCVSMGELLTRAIHEASIIGGSVSQLS